MGLSSNSIQYVAEDSITVSLQTLSNRAKYTLLFREDGTDIIFESFVWKSASGPAEAIVRLQEVLLSFNGGSLTPSITFNMVQTESNDEWKISLAGSQESSAFTPRYLKRVLDVFDEIYTSHIPQIKAFADELNIKFDGKSGRWLSDWVKSVFAE